MDIMSFDVHAGLRTFEIRFHTNSHLRTGFAMVILDLSARRYQWCRPALT